MAAFPVAVLAVGQAAGAHANKEAHPDRGRVAIRNDEGRRAPQDYQLFASFPWRNLYVPVESFHSTVIVDFCNEVLQLFQALRAKNATIKIEWSDVHNEKSGGRVGAMNRAVEASTDKNSSGGAYAYFKKNWPAPKGRPDDPYPLDAESFFFLTETGAPSRTIVHGLDLTAARNAILVAKEDGVKNEGEIAGCGIKLQYIKSADFKLFAKSGSFGEARFASSQKSSLTLTMEYAAQLYKWSAESGTWQ